MLHHSVGQQHPCADTPVVPSRVSLGTTVLPRDVSLVPALLGKHGLCNQPPDCLSSAFWMPGAKATTPPAEASFPQKREESSFAPPLGKRAFG